MVKKGNPNYKKCSVTYFCPLCIYSFNVMSKLFHWSTLRLPGIDVFCKLKYSGSVDVLICCCCSDEWSWVSALGVGAEGAGGGDSGRGGGRQGKLY